MRKVLGVLWLLLAVGNTGCTININLPSGRPNPSSRVEIELGEKGIVDPRFLSSDPPVVLTAGQDLFLTTQSKDFGFDVTFILLIPLPEVRSRVPAATKPEELGELFANALEDDFKGEVTEVQCRFLPRCEVTFTVPPVRSPNQPGFRQIPTQLLQLDAFSATRFQILKIQNPNEQESKRVYVGVENRVGFVTSEIKSAVARLRVPLDNTGIADWGFLNPRNPRLLPADVFELIPGSPEQGPIEMKIAEDALAELKRAPVAGQVSQSILDLAISSVEEIDRVAKDKKSDLEAGEFKRLLDKSILAIRDAAIGEASPQRCTTEFDSARDKSDPQEGADLNRDMSVHEICRITVEAISDAKSSFGIDFYPEREASLKIAKAAVGALGSVARMTPEIDVPTTNLSREADIERIRGAESLREAIVSHYEALYPSDPTIRRSTLEIPPANLGSTLLQLHWDTITSREVAKIALWKVDADRQAEALSDRIRKETLRQQRLRFSNETVDRYFVVTFDLARQELLDAITDPDCENLPPKERDTCELGKIQELYEGSIDLEFSGDTSVTATISVPPGTPGEIDAWLLAAAPKDIVPFNVDFFDQTDDPAYSKGYVALRDIDPTDSSVQPDSKFVSNLITGVTSLYEPCLGGAPCTGALGPNFPTMPPAKPDQNALYDGESKRHNKGRGQLDLSQNLGNRADAKLSLLYEANDFGQTEVDGSSDPVRVSQFQVNVFGTTGLILSLGKFTFAEPSNRIAISEAGEGVRLTWRGMALSYIAKRESNLGTANDDNKDRESILGEVTGAIRGRTPFRRFRATALWGEDRCKPQRLSTSEGVVNGECKDASAFPYTYATLGGEVFFNVRSDKSLDDLRAGRYPLTGSFAVYASHKDARLAGKPDGEGYTGLLSLGIPFDWIFEKEGSRKLKPRRILTAFAGYGTGDDPESADVDEGYIGEGAAFANDIVFLSGIAGAVRKGSLSRPIEDTTHGDRRRIGIGLENKQYLGLQFTLTDSSPLKWIAVDVFKGDERDIISQSSTFSVHGYRFNEPIFGDRNAGFEVDAEFRIEQPQFVKWRLGAGYFVPGDALQSLVKRETWSISAGVVIEPAKLF